METIKKSEQIMRRDKTDRGYIDVKKANVRYIDKLTGSLGSYRIFL